MINNALQILKSVDFTENTRIYMSWEQNIFSSNKNINYTSRATLWQKIVL